MKAMIWDTMGCEKFNSVATTVYRKALGAIVCFDLTSHKSFKAVSKWINEVKDKASKDCQIILVGNKADLCNS